MFARDGLDLAAGQTLASNAAVLDFLDVRAFFAGGGQKRPQRKILREGTHIINPALFVVMTAEGTYALKISDASVPTTTRCATCSTSAARSRRSSSRN